MSLWQRYYTGVINTVPRVLQHLTLKPAVKTPKLQCSRIKCEYVSSNKNNNTL